MTYDARELGSAAIGAAHYVISYGKPNTWGVFMNVRALGKAIAEIPAGPQSELIQAAAAQVKRGPEGDIPEVQDEIDPAMPEALRPTATIALNKALPVIAKLDDEGKAQVRHWLIGIAERVAAASKDKGDKVKVSPAERQAIAEITALLGAA